MEILRYKDIGDPYTTFLAKAIAIARRYRYLFLEGNSPFGPIAIRFCGKEEWKSAINRLLRELRLLIMQSREAGLGERRHIIELYGSDDKAVDGIVAPMANWLDQKSKLYGAAGAVLAEAESAEATFDVLLSTLKEFCIQTKQMTSPLPLRS